MATYSRFAGGDRETLRRELQLGRSSGVNSLWQVWPLFDDLLSFGIFRLQLTCGNPVGFPLPTPDHYNAAFGDKIALAVLFEIVANFGSRRDDV